MKSLLPLVTLWLTVVASSIQSPLSKYKTPESEEEPKVRNEACYDTPKKNTNAQGFSCRGALPSWSYNMTTEHCEYFEYGGCYGSHNLFEEPNDCVKECLALGFEPPTRRFVESRDNHNENENVKGVH